MREQKRSQWRERFEEWRVSGLSAAAWCRNNNIPYPTFCYWKKRLEKTCFLPTQFAEVPPESSEKGLAIEYRGFKIVLLPDFDADTLLRCLEALRATPC